MRNLVLTVMAVLLTSAMKGAAEHLYQRLHRLQPIRVGIRRAEGLEYINVP